MSDAANAAEELQKMMHDELSNSAEVPPAVVSWATSFRVAERYVQAGASNGQYGAAVIAPFMKRSVLWRAKMDVDSMTKDRELLAHELHMRSLLLYDLRCTAVPRKPVRPLLIERVGSWDIAALTASALEAPDLMIRTHVLVNEWMRMRIDGEAERGSSTPMADENGSEERAVNCEGAQRERQAVLVFDMHGLTMAHMRATPLFDVFKQMSRLDSDHFPETVAYMFVVNASRVFTALWAVASMFISTKSQAKVQVFSWNDRQRMHAALQKECGSSVLPVELGGDLVASPPYSAQINAPSRTV